MFGSSLSSMLGQSVQKDPNVDLADTSEVIYIAPQALLKMLKHGRAGIPMEVMGLMLGEFVDNYTIQVVDVFAMPQSGTGIAVEDIDPVYQSQMHDLLGQVGRNEIVVGWYHSHPGMGPWLSNVDQNTHQSFQQLHSRAVALVVDPIQSVKGKVVMDAFRLMENRKIIFGSSGDSRQTTSNDGHCKKASTQALIHGLNRSYYSINCNYKIGVYDSQLLGRLKNTNWFDALGIAEASHLKSQNERDLTKMLDHVRALKKQMAEEKQLSQKEIELKHIGVANHARHLMDLSQAAFDRNLLHTLCSMLMVSSIDQIVVASPAPGSAGQQQQKSETVAAAAS